MKSKSGRIIVGIIFLVAGIAAMGNQLGFWNLDIFFKGWWTLFIIIPFLIDIFEKRATFSNMTGLTVGILLLLTELDFLSWSFIISILTPVALILVGLSLMFGK